MLVQESIERKLAEKFELQHLVVENESHNHNVPANSETHFKVSLVSDAFTGKKLIDRHRLVNDALKSELAGPVHALSIHTYTPDEWLSRHGQTPMSPPCLGGDGSLT